MKQAMPAGRQGFTLVELLVVISIMSILTLITVSQFTTARKKARDVQRKGDLSALSKALQMYFADYGNLPTAATINNNWGGEFKDNTNYVYMKVLPRERTLTTPFCYVVTTDLKSYGLFAMLENTVDSDCHMNDDEGEYVHCGGNHYCYSIVSPNISVDNLVGL